MNEVHKSFVRVGKVSGVNPQGFQARPLEETPKPMLTNALVVVKTKGCFNFVLEGIESILEQFFKPL